MITGVAWSKTKMFNHRFRNFTKCHAVVVLSYDEEALSRFEATVDIGHVRVKHDSVLIVGDFKPTSALRISVYLISPQEYNNPAGNNLQKWSHVESNILVRGYYNILNKYNKHIEPWLP